MDFPPLLSHRLPFQAALHAWYDVHQRPLPWRTTPSLYRTVVSEFMLQQTQVATALPYFERWLGSLPDFAALAAAPADKVLKLWEGLGYYSRARNLHRLAQALQALPAPPLTPAGWQTLPGIGPYTAAAVTSIAFDFPAAVVDGNVVRILARLTAEARRFANGGEAVKFFTPLAGELVKGASSAGRHNQAMMELGATVCLRAKPLCLLCPVAEFCAGRQGGTPEALPRFRPKVTERVSVVRVWCIDRGQLLLRRSATAVRLAGLHELPEAADLGVTPTPASLLATRQRSITRFRITEKIHRLESTAALRRRVSASTTLAWVPLSELETVTLSGPHRRWARELLANT